MSDESMPWPPKGAWCLTAPMYLNDPCKRCDIKSTCDVESERVLERERVEEDDCEDCRNRDAGCFKTSGGEEPDGAGEGK